MPGLRDEITKTIHRLSRRTPKSLPTGDTTLLATDPREGRQYGTYRILRRLGIGGMGHIYLAQDIRLGRHAALKFLSPKLKSNPGMLARLQQEARTASSLNHPNILTIYDIDEADGEPFIASEFVDGITLRQMLERGPVPATAALDIAVQIASALKPAHEAGIIHRDLKPGNIMLRPDGLVKVIDFGLAKLIAHSHAAPLNEPLSDPGAIAGTVQYMSPEQARGDEVDQRTDIWSLGVMLYEMLAHRKPFDGETESHVIVAILDQRVAEFKVAPGLPSGLFRVADKALAKNADKRYQSAEEMLGALRALEVSSHSNASRMLAAALATRRKRSSRGLILALTVALLTALAVWWWHLDGREIIMGPAWFNPAEFTQVTHRGDVILATISPDGKRVAYTTRTNGHDQLHQLILASGKDFSWPPYLGNTLGATFSPDSSAIYLTVHDQQEFGRLYRAKDDSIDLFFVLDDIDGPIAFSPNGSEFAFHRRADDSQSNREAILIAKTADTGEQRTVLSKYSTRVGPRVAWASGGSLAVNLQKANIAGDDAQTVLFFSSTGKELGQGADSPLRRLSGPAWLDSHSTLIFSGFGRNSDESQNMVVELARRTGQFLRFPSTLLASQSLTTSADFQSIAAVSFARKSALWVAPAASLDRPQQWSDGDSFDSLAWTSDDLIVHPSPRTGSVGLWETGPGGEGHTISQPADCMRHYPATVPGKRMLVFASNCGANVNASHLWLLNQENNSLTNLTEHSHSDAWPAVAPDADTVIYNSWPGNSPALLRLSLRTRVKSPFINMQARNAAISPKGLHVAAQIRESSFGKWRFAILSIRNGAIEKDNLPLPVGQNVFVRWSPDATALDYISSQDPANIWRQPLNDSVARPLTHLNGSPLDDFAWNRNGTRLAWVSSDIRQDVIVFHRRSN